MNTTPPTPEERATGLCRQTLATRVSWPPDDAALIAAIAAAIREAEDAALQRALAAVRGCQREASDYGNDPGRYSAHLGTLVEAQTAIRRLKRPASGGAGGG